MKILLLYVQTDPSGQPAPIEPAALGNDPSATGFVELAWREDGESAARLVEAGAGADGTVLVLSAAGADDPRVDDRLVALLDLLDLRQLAVAIDGAAAVDGQARFERLAAAWTTTLWEQGLAPAAAVPIGSASGDNLVERSAAMPWYRGPTLVEALNRFGARDDAAARPLRVVVERTEAGPDGAVVSGRLVSGRLARGDRVLLSPLNRADEVLTLAAGLPPAACDQAEAGGRVALTIADPAGLEPGHILSHADSPPTETDVFRAHLVWSGATPLAAGARYALRLNGGRAAATVQSVDGTAGTVATPRAASDRLGSKEAVEVVLRTDRLLALDPYSADPRTGHVVLIDGDEAVGAGIIDMRGYADQRGLVTVRATNVTRVEHRLTPAERARRNGHTGGVLWLTGLSGSGKSTLALEAERELFDRGYQVYVLDGDNVRHGLNANLGFSPEDRAENIRRVGEVAALFSAAGFIVVTAFISPYRSDRARARAAVPDDSFHEIYLEAGLEVCESRDPKGLYRRARAGEIQDFTGISAPYEAPEAPDLVIDTGRETVEQSVAKLLAYVERHFVRAREQD